MIEVTEPSAALGDWAELPTKPLLRPFGSGQGQDPNDVNQGKLKDCGLAAVLGAMANTPHGKKRIRRMIAFDEQEEVRSKVGDAVVATRGIVRVTLGSNGEIVEISRLLYRDKAEKGPGDILYASTYSGQGWVSFIEKAYAVFRSKHRNPGAIGGMGYASLLMVDAKTVMNDLLAPAVAPFVCYIRKNPSLARRLLNQATVIPTVATTPKSAEFNTPHGAMANHAYTVRGLRKAAAKGGKKLIVKLSCDEDERPLEEFLADFDMIIALTRW